MLAFTCNYMQIWFYLPRKCSLKYQFVIFSLFLWTTDWTNKNHNHITDLWNQDVLPSAILDVDYQLGLPYVGCNIQTMSRWEKTVKKGLAHCCHPAVIQTFAIHIWYLYVHCSGFVPGKENKGSFFQLLLLGWNCAPKSAFFATMFFLQIRIRYRSPK